MMADWKQSANLSALAVSGTNRVVIPVRLIHVTGTADKRPEGFRPMKATISEPDDCRKDGNSEVAM